MLLAIFDLLREDRAVRGGNKGVWAVVIVFVSLLGPILYFLVGRSDDPVEPAQPGPGAMPGWGSPHDPPLVAPPAGADAVARRARAPSPPPAAPSAIEIDHLTKRYPGGILALDGLTMTVPAGSVFGLLGPNGAGKTTTLRLLAGLTRPTAGRARLAGAEVSSDAVDARRGLGYLEQDPRAYAWMTGREQLRLLGRLHGLRGASLESAVEDALARVDLGAAADRRAGSYSGGMRQRLGIAGALVHRPRVAILDEPVSSLDPEGRRDVLNLIAALRGEINGAVLDPRAGRRRADLRSGRDPGPRAPRGRGPAGGPARSLRPPRVPHRGRARPARRPRRAGRDAARPEPGSRASASTTGSPPSPSRTPIGPAARSSRRWPRPASPSCRWPGRGPPSRTSSSV